MNFLFSENSKLMKSIWLDLKSKFNNNELNKDIFDNFIIEINKCSFNSYKSDDEDIEDLEDLLIICNMIIELIFNTKENYEKYKDILSSRKQIKKFAHKKFREAHDQIHCLKIENNLTEKKIKYDDEKPRKFFNYELYHCQYNELLYIWNSSNSNIKKMLSKIII